MNDLFAEAATVDPEWARKEARRIFWIKVLTPITILAIIGATAALVIGVHNDTRLTRVEHSACAQAFTSGRPDKKAEALCAVVRAETARHEPIENPCISYQRVTGEQGANCPRFYVHR